MSCSVVAEPTARSTRTAVAMSVDVSDRESMDAGGGGWLPSGVCLRCVCYVCVCYVCVCALVRSGVA